MQKVDYSYNIRGWLKTINDVNDIGNDLFSFKINYNDADTATDLFNGNISETYWKTATDNIKRGYTYNYDHLNRLIEGNYQREGSQSLDCYLEKMTYDKNGNIQTLRRHGDNDNSNYLFVIDNLEYSYHPQNPNLLMKVFDASNSPQGFKDDTTGIDDTTDDYTYDANGNMISDTNKGIQHISYNHLNLPTQILFGNGFKIYYLYNALGQKVKKVVNNPDKTETEYLTGFQYYNQRLKHFPHAEGYVNVVNGRFKYVFNFTDHLGNIRLSYSDANNNNLITENEVLEENHYYPFGLKHSAYNTLHQGYISNDALDILILQNLPKFAGDGSYNYQYNGKEWQDELGLNFYDYGARNYDPAIGRWMNVDNMSEKYLSLSPYHYAGNNPIINIDIDGNEFTNNAWKWVNKLIEDINSKQENNNSSIAKLKEKIAEGGSDKQIAKWNKNINSLTGKNAELESARAETAILAASSQVYDVVSDNGGTERDVLGNSNTINQATFNSENNRVQLTVSSGTGLGLFAHELKHMYQFEIGETSLGLTKNGGAVSFVRANVLFYDLTDEVEAYQRGALFGHNDNINSITDVRRTGVYSSKIPSGPINFKNHPDAAGIKSTPQLYANTYNAAFRIDNKTYKPQ